jgi:hypothetical protein
VGKQALGFKEISRLPLVVWSLELCISAIFAVAQQPETTFRSSSNLALVDVVALSARNGLPNDTLQRDDFQSIDDGQRLRSLRLIAAQGSGLFAGRVSLFQPALKSLNKQDMVGVAHWCDDGQSKLDLLPTNDIERATAALEQRPGPPRTTTIGLTSLRCKGPCN